MRTLCPLGLHEHMYTGLLSLILDSLDRCPYVGSYNASLVAGSCWC